MANPGKDLEKPHPGGAILFGDFRLLPVVRTLTKNGAPVQLGARALDILIALIERAGQVVSKQELFSIVWPNTFLEESNLRVHIAGLRKVLGDGQSGRRFIVSIPRRGYMFVAEAERKSVDERDKASRKLEGAVERNYVPLPLVSIIGRDEELNELSDHLLRNRFITITGTGGIGKTTVALALVEKLSSSFRDGVLLVDLGSLAASLVTSHLASLLRLPAPNKSPLQHIVAHLRPRRMLIIFDNCEHVIETISEIAEAIFRGAPDIHILATSREPLRATGEWVRRLSPLAVPPTSSELTAAEAVRFPAVQLFVERAISGESSGRITDADAPIVAETCTRLDGLPLAIELAATRVPLFGLRGLADRLDDRFSILTKGRRTALPRHQTLEAMIDWSYETLSHDEKVVWRRLAVFPGAFSMEAAVAVANHQLTGDFVDILDALLEKSLVSVEIYGGAARYRLLESLRLYSFKKLTETTEVEAVKRSHAQYWYGCSLGYGSNWMEAPSAEWLGKHSNDTVDIRAALEWAFANEGDSILGIRMTVASVSLFFKLLLLHELRGYLELAIQLAPKFPEIDDALVMRLHIALNYSIFHAQGHAGEAITEIAKALALAEQRNDIDTLVQFIWVRWGWSVTCGDYAALMPWVERARDVLVRAPNHPTAPFVYSRMAAMTEHFWGEQIAAIRQAEQVLERAATRRKTEGHGLTLTHDHRVGANMTYARALWISGRPDKAWKVIRDTIAEMLDDHPEGGPARAQRRPFRWAFF